MRNKSRQVRTDRSGNPLGAGRRPARYPVMAQLSADPVLVRWGNWVIVHDDGTKPLPSVAASTSWRYGIRKRWMTPFITVFSNGRYLSGCFNILVPGHR